MRHGYAASSGLSAPSAVVFDTSRKAAWVANRGDATVRRIDALDTASPVMGASVNVGSEPTGLALSPTGRFLAVAEWAEARVSIIDTQTASIVSSVSMRNPRAVSITNNLDAIDSDEKVIVTEFYGRATASPEATDSSRQGAVRVFSLSAAGALTDDGQVLFSPQADGGFGVGFSPNQLFNVAVQNGRMYIPAIGASPAGPVAFDKNVAPVVLVANVTTKAEILDGAGSQSLAPLVSAFPAPQAFLADLVDLSFLGGTNIAYAVSRGGEVVQRIVYDTTANTISLGSSMNKQIDLVGNATIGNCFNPTGIVVSQTRVTAFVNCWGSQRLGVVDLASQSLSETVVSVPAPTSAPELSVNRGRHFFFTGRTRWSNNAWSSCGSCHPDGLSDNMTWTFAAGPRQSTSMDGSYSKGATVKQRIFNWTGIIDEMHDFEGNTRGTQGGKGAITTATLQTDCGTLGSETGVALPANNLAGSAKELADANGVVRCLPGAWDDIDNYAKTIRAPQGRRFLDPAAVTRGAAAFDEGQCAKCHGGPGWTVSRRFYTPGASQNASLTGTVVFAKPSAWPSVWTFQNTFQIATQPLAAELPGFNAANIAPPQVACAIRNVGTFGVPGSTTLTDALELKPGAGGRSQGRGGFNIPSLYGLQVATPLLHHGQAATLTDLLTDPKWDAHTQSGNAVFLPSGDPGNAAKRFDLVQYLWSIDGSSVEKAVPAGFDTGCMP